MGDRDVTELDAILADVLAKPDDDTPRLVMADKLDDLGEALRAEFIRVQCRLALVPFDGVNHNVGESPLTLAEFRELGRREKELFRLIPGWTPHGSGTLPWDNYSLVQCGRMDGEWRSLWWRRGFVEAVICESVQWLAHADTILAAHPVRRVRLTTWPRLQELARPNGCRIRLRGRQKWYKVADTRGMLCTQYALEHEWPGVAFELPAQAARAVEGGTTVFRF